MAAHGAGVVAFRCGPCHRCAAWQDLQVRCSIFYTDKVLNVVMMCLKSKVAGLPGCTAPWIM